MFLLLRFVFFKNIRHCDANCEAILYTETLFISLCTTSRPGNKTNAGIPTWGIHIASMGDVYHIV